MAERPKDKTIQVGDLNVRYWDVGSGDSTIVLVHGFAACVEYWENNIFELAKNHRVIAVDLIGFGETDKPKIIYDLFVFQHFLRAFLSTLKISKVSLVGHSLGGAICLFYTLNYPESVEKLVLVDSVGFDSYVPWGFRLLTLPLVGKILRFASPKHVGNFIKQFVYDKTTISDDFIHRLYGIYAKHHVRHTITSFLKQYVNLLGVRKVGTDVTELSFSKLSLPILIIWGREDRLMLVRGAKKAKELMPWAELQILDQCGHIPPIEKPQEFNQLVENFLSR